MGNKTSHTTSLVVDTISISTSPPWLESIPCPKILTSRFSRTNIIALNSKEIFCALKSFDYVACAFEFWIYNIPKLEWRLLETFMITPKGDRIVFDKEKQLIYFLTYTGIAVYDLKSNSIQEYDNAVINYNYHDNNYGPILELIEHKLQIICGNPNDKHIECDIEKKECKELYQFKKYQHGLTDAASVYLQNKGELWLISGYSCRSRQILDIHLYSIKDNKWKLLDIQLPFALRKCTCICSGDERFIITFGGDPVSKVKIFIIDTELLKIKESSIECPMKDDFQACLVKDTVRSDLIVTGFVNEFWNEEGFKNDDNLRYLSNDIIGVIVLFYCEETIHLFRRYGPGHWTMNLIDLLM